MRENHLLNKRMYDYNAGGHCGVVMPESVMKKLAKLNYEYSNEVKKILEENKGSLYVSDWTLANLMDGEKIKKQVTIRYAILGEDVDHRISLYKANSPTYIKEFYLVKNREEAKEISEEILQELIEEERG